MSVYVPWSTLGVNSSNTPDQNAAALAALPSPARIECDNPGGGEIATTEWVVKSGQEFCGSDTPISIAGDGTIRGTNGINQPNNRLANIGFRGLSITKGGVAPLFSLSANYLTITYCTFNVAGGVGQFHGDGFEYAYNRQPAQAIKNGPGVRLFPNQPNVPPPARFPFVSFEQAGQTRQAHCWIHDNVIVSNDATMQVDPGPSDNGGANDILFEGNDAYAFIGATGGLGGGNGTLLGGGLGLCEFITVRDNRIFARGNGIRICGAACAGTPGFANIQFIGNTVDGSVSDKTPKDLANGLAFTEGASTYDAAPIVNLLIKDHTCTGQFCEGLLLGNVTNAKLINVRYGAPRRLINNDYVVRADQCSGVIITGCDLDDTNVPAALALNSVENIIASGNTFHGKGTITKNGVAAATITSNTIKA